ncbi:MAG: hypothetical protein RLZZ500_2044 [Bacteroidota bacterium]
MRKLGYLLLLWSLGFQAQVLEKDLCNLNWKVVQWGKKDTLKATVPGTIHTDLLVNHRIPDPFLKANEKEVQWIENEDWVYEAQFSLSEGELQKEHIELVFEGLDTYAYVFLNGQSILDADNMFRTWRVDVKSFAKAQNHLKIQFKSAVQRTNALAQRLPYQLPDDNRVFARKAPYQFGWDWGPRLVTCGIWKPLKIQFWDTAKINHVVHEITSLTPEKAEVNVHVALDMKQGGKVRIELAGITKTVQVKAGSQTISLPIQIDHPQLWWCNDLGTPHLYPLSVQLFQKQKEVDRKEIAIGLRTIEWVQEPDAKGKSFYFKLNGQPVFMKGSNVIPPDSFVPRTTPAQWETLVENARLSHHNMLRVWGGGVYADDAFYKACDEKGILVWQDFMFACAMYPGDEPFLQSVEKEVEDQVKRLQNHPSIALWCGNNESDEGWHNWGWQKQYKYTAQDSARIWNDYQQLFRQRIPNTLNRLLPQNENRYWPSSPSIGWGKKESLTQGDSHYWGVWWGLEPFEIYDKKVGRFMSEYGFQAMPSMAMLRLLSDGEPLSLQSNALRHHQKHRTGFETIATYMQRDFQVPAVFEDYVYVSQLLQAKGMQQAIEAHRRNRPYCMGSLYWQLNDCWPVTSWSSIDYLGNWKALHYQVKRSFAPQLIVPHSEPNGHVVIDLINDVNTVHEGELLLKWVTLNGIVRKEKRLSAQLPANGVRSYSLDDFEDCPQLDGSVVLHVQFLAPEIQLSCSYTGVAPKNMKLQKPKIALEKINDTTIAIQTDVFAKNVALESSEAIRFSDNYFDLLPGETKYITFDKPMPATLTIKSLWDTLP